MTGADLAAEVISLLTQRRETLATAESLTGGLLGAMLTGVPGASQVYRGGVISYATDLKGSLAGVSAGTLTRHGPVAHETAEEMARGVAERCASRYGLAVTGVAGPEAQDSHPVGQVFVALAVVGRDAAFVEEHQLSGSRAEIRDGTARLALRLLADHLRANRAAHESVTLKGVVEGE